MPYEAVQDVTKRYMGAVDWVIFYIGDYDPAGVLIDKAIERELRQHIEAYHEQHKELEIELYFQRVGITEGQVREYDLPTKPRKEGDKRALHITYTVEAEAMPANILRELLRDEVEALLPDGALKAAKVAEELEKQAINLAALAMEQAA